MGTSICKFDDWYFDWSSIVDAPTSCAMTRDEYIARALEWEGRRYVEQELPARLARADAKGTSSLNHASLSQTVWLNRAGRSETFLSLSEIKQLVVLWRTDPKAEMEGHVPPSEEDSFDLHAWWKALP